MLILYRLMNQKYFYGMLAHRMFAFILLVEERKEWKLFFFFDCWAKC